MTSSKPFPYLDIINVHSSRITVHIFIQLIVRLSDVLMAVPVTINRMGHVTAHLLDIKAITVYGIQVGITLVYNNFSEHINGVRLLD